MPTPELDGTPILTGSAVLSDALLRLGDQWSLEILRAVMMHVHRFGQLSETLGVTDPVLAKRLHSLTSSALLVKQQYSSSPPRFEYHLTPMAQDLWPLFTAVWLWDREWSGQSVVPIQHRLCGRRFIPVFGCGRCQAIGVTPRDTMASVDTKLASAVVGVQARRGVRNNLAIGRTAISILGDSWSTAILSGAMLGVRRFRDFKDRMPGISPVTLTERLSQLMEADVLYRKLIVAGGRRMEYRLTPKGKDFFAIFCTLNHWAQTHLSDDGRSGLNIVHGFCGEDLQPQYTCNGCNGVLAITDIDVVTRTE